MLFAPIKFHRINTSRKNPSFSFMQLLHDSFILLALSQLVTTSVYFFLYHRTRSGSLFIALFICLACYLLYEHSALNDTAARYLYGVSLITPILLYAIARYLFIDGSRMKIADWIFIAYFVFFREIVGVNYIDPVILSSQLLLVLVYMLPLAILIYFSVMAAVFTLQGYKNDLLENRRTLRVYFVISTLVFVIPRLVSGLYVYSRMLMEISGFEPVRWPGIVNAIYIFLIFLGFNLSIFRKHKDLLQLFTITRIAPGIQDSLSPAVEMLEPQPTEVTLVSRIVELMVNDRLYAQQGFTISDLASALAIHEHKLRRTINSELNFRNFNQFLNHYRLQEASRHLKNSTLPVSTIAYDVGYSSLSSFNSVFKNQFKVTPTEYRHTNHP